jgi:hypothetical protein
MAGKSVFLTLVSKLKGKGIEEATKDFKKLGGQFEKLNRNALKLGASFAALKVGQAGARFIGDSVEQSRDLTRNLNGLQTVFEGTTSQMVDFAKNASDMGLSMNQAAKASTFIGSVLKQSGFSIAETADLTERLVGLGTDLAITYGYDVQEALLGMTALFRGEYDPIEKFGVAMKQSEINAELAARELDKLTGASRRLAEQQIRVELLFERADDALGQYAKQAGTLFAAQQTLRAEFTNLQSFIGYALTPAFAELALALRPLVVELAPVLLATFKALIPVVESLTANKEQFAKTVLGALEVLLGLVKVFGAVATVVFNNITLVKNLAIGFIGLQVAFAITAGLKTAFDLLTGAIAATAGAAAYTNKQLAIMRIRLATTGIGLIAVLLGSVAAAFMTTGKKAEEGLGTVSDYLDEATESTLNLADEAPGAYAVLEDMGQSLDDVGASAAKASDAVGDFFGGLADDAAKLSAELQLETLGASEGLIERILGSGDEWYKVFEEVTRNGMASVQEVQAMFLQTASGFDEAMDAWQAEFDAFTDFKEAAQESMRAFGEFVREFEILPSIASELGTFERAAVDRLSSIEEKLKDAFDNGYLLDESYQNLLNYSRTELAVLQDIERQRDQLLARRDAASALINSVQKSVQESAKITQILGNVQDTAEGVDAVQFAKRVVISGQSLKEFSTALITNFADPIEQARSKADLLVDGYRSVVERTREFVENIKALKALGLDPQLFNQLVQAGVEAGGETAQALVDGGAETVNEINSLFGELDALGAELGENTAQVMYGQGENFVNGIVEGLDSQLGELESMANSLADSFTTTFEEVLIAGIERAIAAAEAALARMPKAPGFDYAPSGGGSGGAGGAGGGTSGTSPITSLSPRAVEGGDGAPPMVTRSAFFDSVREQVVTPEQQFLSALSGRPAVPYTETKINIYTSSQPDAVANSLRRFTNTNSSFDLNRAQNRRDLQ